MTEMPNRQQTAVASVGVYARGKFRGNLKICRPSELFVPTPARQAARPLAIKQKKT